MRSRRWLALCMTGGMSVALCAQQSIPPPPKPADSGPSLAVTMQFIQEKLSQFGKLNFANYVHDNSNNSDWIVQKSFEVSNVVAHPESCIISFHFRLWNNGSLLTDMDGGVPFRNVADVVILPIEQDWKEFDSKAGNTTWSYKSDPPVFVLRVRRQQGGGYNEFDFTDEDMANRVAKAMVHAVELCGGGNKEPF